MSRIVASERDPGTFERLPRERACRGRRTSKCDEFVSGKIRSSLRRSAPDEIVARGVQGKTNFVPLKTLPKLDSVLAIIWMVKTPAQLLLSARKAAGLTQRDLARRARTSQSVIARIESGASSPSWDTLKHLLNRAGFDLRASLTRRAPSHMLEDVARILSLAPEERLLELRNAARFFATARPLSNGPIRS